jgi:hypothetical protein
MAVLAVLVGQSGGDRDLQLLDLVVAGQRLTREEAADAGPCLGAIRGHLATGRFGELSVDQLQPLVEGHVRACVAETRARLQRPAGEPTSPPPRRAQDDADARLSAAEQGLRTLAEAIAQQRLSPEESDDARGCLLAMRPQIAAGLFLGATPDQVRTQVDGFVAPCVAQTRSALAAQRARREEQAAHQATERAGREAEEAVRDYSRTHPGLLLDYQSWVRCSAQQDLDTAVAGKKRALRKGRRGAPPDPAVVEEFRAAEGAAKVRLASADAALAELHAAPRACTSKAVKQLEACLLLQKPPSLACAAAQWLSNQP